MKVKLCNAIFLWIREITSRFQDGTPDATPNFYLCHKFSHYTDSCQ